MVMQLCCGQLGNREITYAEFTTAGTPNGRVGPAAITPIPVGSAFHAMEKIPLLHLLLTHGWQKFELSVFFLRRPRYRSNRWWKYSIVTSIATAVKVAIVISQSVLVLAKKAFIGIHMQNRYHGGYKLRSCHRECTGVKMNKQHVLC